MEICEYRILSLPGLQWSPFPTDWGTQRSILLTDGIFTLVAIGGIRVAIRLYFGQKAGVSVLSLNPASNSRSGSKRGDSRLLIVGAGDAGEKALRELNDNPRLHYNIVGFLDDDPTKVAALFTVYQSSIPSPVSLEQSSPIEWTIFLLPFLLQQAIRCDGSWMPVGSVNYHLRPCPA